MPKLTPALVPTERDTALLDRLAQIERVTLAAAIVLFALNLAGRLALLLGGSFPGGRHLMDTETAVAGLLCGFSLQFSSLRDSKFMRRLALLLAAAAALMCAAIVCGYVFHIWPGIEAPAAAGPDLASSLSAKMSLQTAGAFGLLGLSLTLIGAQKRAAVLLADLLIFCLVLLVLILVSAHVIAMLGVFGPVVRFLTPSLTVPGLFLLTSVAFLRKAENGVFSILLGHGIGSNIARGLSPILLALPYLRECARARFIGAGTMPAPYTTAILASVAVMLSLGVLLFLAWRINYMEVEIHDLSLRDALTDLYNLRGFRLLAEQSQRMARRTNLPFSVLFIDLDGLKRINDSLGHQAGSELLVETGKILKSSFRETDVIGRIGGDEFAVAGQFSRSGISLAAQRVEECTARRNAESGHAAALSFSAGYATTDSLPYETLDELLAKADRAMYEAKRRKKIAAG